MGINWKAGCYYLCGRDGKCLGDTLQEQEHGPLSGPDRRRRIESLMEK